MIWIYFKRGVGEGNAQEKGNDQPLDIVHEAAAARQSAPVFVEVTG